MAFKIRFREILVGRIGSKIVATLAVGTLALAANTGYAQTARSGGGASAQLMQQMQQLASERTSLQAENAKLKKDLEEMRKDRDALKNAQGAVGRRVQTSEIALKQSLAQRASTEQELAQTKEKMQQLIAKFRESLQTLRDVETERTTAKQALDKRDQDLKVCVDHNLALYKLNDEVLTRLEHQSVWTRVAQAEPFTRIKRTQLENLVDEYKDRADVQRIDPSQAAGTSSTSGAPSSVQSSTSAPPSTSAQPPSAQPSTSPQPVSSPAAPAPQH